MAKLVQYGERIWHIDQGTDEERADKAIQKTEEFFKSLGLLTHKKVPGKSDTFLFMRLLTDYLQFSSIWPAISAVTS